VTEGSGAYPRPANPGPQAPARGAASAVAPVTAPRAVVGYYFTGGASPGAR
jgi:hypothetical protein